MKKLAPNNRLSNTITPFLILIALIFLTIQLIGNEITTTKIIFLSVGYLITTSLLYTGYRSMDIFYDENHLHLKGHKGTMKVPLLQVKKLKMTVNNIRIMGFKFYQYTINYSGDSGSQFEVTFWTFVGSSGLDDFVVTVKNVNPYFKIHHIATP